jgi:hypothetical protein
MALFFGQFDFRRPDRLILRIQLVGTLEARECAIILAELPVDSGAT